MHLHSHHALKPLDLTGRAHSSRSKLLPGDMSSILTHGHGRRGHSGLSPLLHSGKPATQHEQLIEQTRKWVAQTFFGTLMKQMRNSPFKSKMLEGGRGGEAFGEMLDQRLVDHMSRGVGNKLVNSIVKRIEAKNAKAASAAYQQQSRLHASSPPAQAQHQPRTVKSHVATGH